MRSNVQAICSSCKPTSAGFAPGTRALERFGERSRGAVAVSVTLILSLAFVLHSLDTFYVNHRPATETERL